MKERRAKTQAETPNASTDLRNTVLKNIVLPPKAILAGYSAIGSEIDPSPLMEALRAQGHVIALPAVIQEGLPLRFQRYEPGDRLLTSPMGIAEPLSSAPTVTPDILLVPLLAFDRHRHRLGYGGGFYDRTIRQLRQSGGLMTIGIAYAAQEIPEVPRGKYDVQLDKIATEIQAFQD
jgi:5-formyltetrahydrofolate cyclo-ligase